KVRHFPDQIFQIFHRMSNRELYRSALRSHEIHDATIGFRVKDPLVGPLAAIAAGILVARFVPFHSAELLATIAAYLLLGIVSISRGLRFLAGASCCSGLFFAGALTSIAHVPAPPPELDVEAREIVILSGCVVEPPAISGERERFLLELEPHARV